MLYDTALLRTFVAVCDRGSFTKAAAEVNLTQSAVSLHVKRLEDQVGSRLIVRSVRGTSATITTCTTMKATSSTIAAKWTQRAGWNPPSRSQSQASCTGFQIASPEATSTARSSRTNR